MFQTLWQKILAGGRTLASTIPERFKKTPEFDGAARPPDAPQAGAAISNQGRQILPRLAYWFRRSLPAFFQPARRSVEYETHLSIESETGLEILDGAAYSFPLPFAGQNFRAQAAPTEARSGEGAHSRGLRLALLIEAETRTQAWFLRLPAVRSRLQERLRHLAARILFYARSGEHRQYAFSSREYATGRWLRELYPALNPASFPEAGCLPAGWHGKISDALPALIAPPQHAAFAERRRMPLRRRRRILLIPIRARRAEVEGILPPPFEARWRNSREIPAGRAELRLYLRICLDGGPLLGADDRRKFEMKTDASGEGALPGLRDHSKHAPPDLSEYETRMHSGDENHLYIELLCPALLHSDPVRTRGWLPLMARRFPLNRPVLPWDELSCSYRVRSDGLRFCLGDARRRLLGASVWRPLRGLRAGEFPPRLLRSRPAGVFVQSPESLDVHLFRESAVAPANRIYLLERLVAPAPQESAPGERDVCDFLEGQLGLALTAERHAWFASYADVATLSEQRIPLDECHYRNPRPAILLNPG